MFYIVSYKGPFGFIKPWTAVRDEETFSQQFLTPATLRGIEQRLFPELLEDYKPKIARYRLRYSSFGFHLERTQPKTWKVDTSTGNKAWIRPRSIIKRGVLHAPELLLAFVNETDAQRAVQNHICLCRNEDVMLPDGLIQTIEEADFIENTRGFEFITTTEEEGFLAGFNRFTDNSPMYGALLTVGNPLESE